LLPEKKSIAVPNHHFPFPTDPLALFICPTTDNKWIHFFSMLSFFCSFASFKSANLSWNEVRSPYLGRVEGSTRRSSASDDDVNSHPILNLTNRAGTWILSDFCTSALAK
jgi:hypothetical protein